MGHPEFISKGMIINPLVLVLARAWLVPTWVLI